ncbi:YcjX family GTP-binding protein [Granulibacter bethesdensis]|uniref:YcjX family protein n=1 Tax=Granulibacter bethesdensis TaxID=364410 RepID=UPI0003F20DD6|nr:YcjX family protein [Granulibacter bethesdensis]AHJ66657.1 Hypothetical protein GbCGDNIH4_0947 [Granulibacter bethesdensis CGDNIH4]
MALSGFRLPGWDDIAGPALGGRSVVRIGITGLARSGKTAFLTSVAANLLAQGAGLVTLPALQAALQGRALRVAIAPSGTESIPRFDYAAHMASLAADPPAWPERTDTVSMLALDLTISRSGLASVLPERRIRLECLDYPGEWLLDLPMLAQDYEEWSGAVLTRLEGQAEAAGFLGFVKALPASAPADEAIAEEGTRLYRAMLHRLREHGLSFLQPGRMLMPPPGLEPPWMGFFPSLARGGLGGLLSGRYDRYRQAIRDELMAPSFGRVDRLVVMADLLSALHAGPDAYADAASALGAVASALRWRGGWTDSIPLLREAGRFLPEWLRSTLLPGTIARAAFVASKADHVAERQRGNLAALMGLLTDSVPERFRQETARGGRTRAFAMASVRCTEDFVWTLDGHPVSAVRGRLTGSDRITRSYPGEVPDRPPEPSFWAHRFLAPPDFEPMRLPAGGRAGIPHLGLDTLLAWLLEDVL